MYGLSVKGKTYNPITYEISIEPVTGKVIDIGTSIVRFWPNGSGSQITISVDVLICSPSFDDGASYSDSETIIIPFYLLTRVSGASIDSSLSSYVKGPQTNFITDNRSDFTESGILIGGLIRKCKCPVIFWENSFNPRVIGFSDFLLCYPTSSSILPYTFDNNSLLFIEEVKSTFIYPTYTNPSWYNPVVDNPVVDNQVVDSQ